MRKRYGSWQALFKLHVSLGPGKLRSQRLNVVATLTRTYKQIIAGYLEYRGARYLGKPFLKKCIHKILNGFF